MNIDWVIPCRYAEIHDNLGTVIGAGIDTFFVPELPTRLQVVLAIRLLAMADELGVDNPHQVRNLIKNPRGETISDIQGEMTADSADPRTDWLNGIMVPSLVWFEVTEEGTYSIEYQIDDSSKVIPIHVIRALPG